MIDHSRSKEELSFAYGWASHVVADIIGHPDFTNITHAEIVKPSQKDPEPVEAYDQPLEHKKTEFGASAYLLGLDENVFLWDVKLKFPFEVSQGEDIISRVFLMTYAIKIDREGLYKAVKSLRKEMRRIPIVVKFIGSIKGPWYDIIERMLGFLLRKIAVPIYIPLLDKDKNHGVIAVLQPFMLSPKQIERLNNVNSRIIESFVEYLQSDFSKMSNLNLDTGSEPISGKSKHGDKLIDILEEEGIEKRFKDTFKGEDNFLKFWKEFKKKFLSKKI